MEFERTEIDRLVTFDPVRSIIFLLAVFIIGCDGRPNVEQIKLLDLHNSETQINPSEYSLTVIYFLSPECPLCINYTLAMRELEDEFASNSIKFYGVFSKEWYSKEEVNEFRLKYDLDFEMLFDTELKLAKTLKAKVTPQVFVLDAESNILYSGKIDNWVNELGKKKLEVSDRYLRNALVSCADGQPVRPKETEPIGCLIE